MVTIRSSFGSYLYHTPRNEGSTSQNNSEKSGSAPLVLPDLENGKVTLVAVSHESLIGFSVSYRTQKEQYEQSR
jgi:hypothetical protein